MTERVDVFISYAFEDEPLAQEFAATIGARGLVPWYAQSQQRAGHWRSRVEAALDAATVVLVLVTGNITASYEVENEYRRAARKNKPIMAIQFGNCTAPLYLSSIERITCRQDFDTEELAGKVEELHRLRTAERREAELGYLSRTCTGLAPYVDSYFRLDLELKADAVTHQPDYSSLVRHALGNYSSSERQESILDTARTLTGCSVDEALRVVLIGDSGSGKTATLHRIYFDAALAAENSALQPIPFYIPLNRLANGQNFLDYIRQIGDREFPGLVDFIDELCAQGRALLLIDGLNDIIDSFSDPRTQEVRGFLNQFPSTSVVATGIVEEYTPERSLGLSVLRIRPLTPIQVRSFIAQRIHDPSEADSLFWALVGESRAREFWEEFSGLGGSESEFWLHTDARPGIGYRGDRPYYHWNLWLRVRDNPQSLLALARRPYLLSLLVEIYNASRTLPSSSYDLFRVFTRVMYDATDTAARQSADTLLNEESLTGFLGRLAEKMHSSGHYKVRASDIETIMDQTHVAELLSAAQAMRILDVGDDISFTHRLICDYYACKALEDAFVAGQSFSSLWGESLAGWWDQSEWNGAAEMLIGKYRPDVERLLHWISADQPELAARCIRSLEGELSFDQFGSLFEDWQQRLTQPSEPPQGRAAIGRALGRLGADRRSGVLTLDNHGWPVFDWVSIGNTPEHRGDQDLSFTRYLVTNSLFQPFIDAGGYTERYRECWTTTGWQWRSLANRHCPDDYTELFRISNHPRIGTTWYEADAYARWVTSVMVARGELPECGCVRLPTEREWEWASGRAYDTKYPWGDTYNANYCNISEIRSTCAVGIYPEGASPVGIMDLVGNAWSWCLTKWDNDPEIQNNSEEGSDARVYRGASWAFDYNISVWRPEELVWNRRYWISPLDDRPDAIGFFLVKDPCCALETTANRH